MSTSLRMRPRFRARIALSPSEARQRMVEAVARKGSACHGPVGEDKIELMARVEHHFWSPELRARFRDADGGCALVGRFGPKPAVWTMFMVIYIHLAFIAVAGMMYAGAQATLGRSPSALLAVPAALAAAGLVYLASRIGQRLGASEMHQITEFVEGVYGVTADTDA